MSTNDQNNEDEEELLEMIKSKIDSLRVRSRHIEQQFSDFTKTQTTESIPSSVTDSTEKTERDSLSALLTHAKEGASSNCQTNQPSLPQQGSDGSLDDLPVDVSPPPSSPVVQLPISLSIGQKQSSQSSTQATLNSNEEETSQIIQSVIIRESKVGKRIVAKKKVAKEIAHPNGAGNQESNREQFKNIKRSSLIVPKTQNIKLPTPEIFEKKESEQRSSRTSNKNTPVLDSPKTSNTSPNSVRSSRTNSPNSHTRDNIAVLKQILKEVEEKKDSLHSIGKVRYKQFEITTSSNRTEASLSSSLKKRKSNSPICSVIRASSPSSENKMSKTSKSREETENGAVHISSTPTIQPMKNLNSNQVQKKIDAGTISTPNRPSSSPLRRSTKFSSANKSSIHGVTSSDFGGGELQFLLDRLNTLGPLITSVSTKFEYNSPNHVLGYSKNQWRYSRRRKLNASSPNA